MNPTANVRPSPIAGQWYSADPQELRASVSAFIDRAVLPPLPGEVLALVAPHAGHIYSGATAGYAYRAVQGKSFDLVAVVSPMHVFHPAMLLTSAHRAYGTPLGVTGIDADAVQQFSDHLLQSGQFPLTPVANDMEHSLEIQLPFLQCALAGDFKLLPVMIRSLNPVLARAVGAALAKTLKGCNALLVASTDLSHFYSRREAEHLDREMLHQIEAFSPEGVLHAEDTGSGFACGAPAVAAVLWAAKELGAASVSILHHSTSAETTGDASSVVGYGAAAILKPATH